MTLLPIDTIRTDGGTQPRDRMIEEVVSEYADALNNAAEFPPIVAFYDGSDYWLADGFHMLTAHRSVGRKQIRVDVRQGTRRDAILFSVGANAAHGLPRTNADKRRAVLTLLRDGEWVKRSDSEIARRCAVTHPFVGKLRAETIPVTVTGMEAPAQRRFIHPKTGAPATMNTANMGKCPVGAPVFDATSAGERVEAEDDPLHIPEFLDRRKPAFPPAHAPITGKVDYLIEELVRSWTLGADDLARATTRNRAEQRMLCQQLSALLTEYAKELRAHESKGHNAAA